MLDWIAKLERAKRLLDSGALTPQEFDAEKAKLLPRATSEQGVPRFARTNATLGKPLLPTFIGVGVVTVLIVGGALMSRFWERQPSIIDPQEVAAVANSPQSPTPTQHIAVPTSAPPPAADEQTSATTDLVNPDAAAAEAEFGCVGAYSNVTFSKESGDGSGLFIRIRPKASVTFSAWEGGVSVADAVVSSSSSERMLLNVRFANDPNGSAVTLICREDRLNIASGPWSPASLQRLSERQAAELEAG